MFWPRPSQPSGVCLLKASNRSACRAQGTRGSGSSAKKLLRAPATVFMEKSFSTRSNPWSARRERQRGRDQRKINPLAIAIILAKQSAACHLPLLNHCLYSEETSAIITRQTAASNKSADERLTLLKLPLHALHLRFVATYAVQTLRIQA